MDAALKELIDDCTTELNDIEAKINGLSPLDKTKVYLTKYALIKASGTVEFVYRSIVADWFCQYAVPQLDYYLDNTVRAGSMSATYDNMSKLLGKFDVEWSKDFKKSVEVLPDKNRLIQASNSLVTNRHSFAHGREPTATFGEIKQYYHDVLILIDELDLAVH